MINWLDFMDEKERAFYDSLSKEEQGLMLMKCEEHYQKLRREVDSSGFEEKASKGPLKRLEPTDPNQNPFAQEGVKRTSHLSQLADLKRRKP